MTLSDVLGRAGALLWLAGWTTLAVVRASAMVARDIIAPSARLVPGILVLPLRCTSALEVAAVSGLITITPGTLTVHVDEDLRELWVHGLYAGDPEQLRAELTAVESRVLRALRHPRPVEVS